VGKTVDCKGIEHCAKYGAVTRAPDHDRPVYCGGKSVKPREGIVGWKPITNLSKSSDGIQDIEQDRGDTIRVQCTFDPTLRQLLPELKGLPPRYVTWGEGSSDEMCLGVIAATPA